MNPSSPEVRVAVDSVIRACTAVRRVQREMISPALSKEDQSPVTVGDFAAQALVAADLADAFPDDPLVGEEDAAALRDPAQHELLEQVAHFVRSERSAASPETICDWIDRGAGEPAQRYWTLDPIDGTKGFLRGDQYAIALALFVNGELQLGILGCPNLNTHAEPDVGGEGALFVALRSGARAHPLWGSASPTTSAPALRASGIANPREARLLRSVEASHTDGDKIGELAAQLGIEAAPVPMDSQAKYAVLAAGGGDVILRLLSPKRPDYREKIWDQAAGALLVAAAGGRITDLDGKSLDFRQGRTLAQNRGVLATNGPLHGSFIEGLRAIGA